MKCLAWILMKVGICQRADITQDWVDPVGAAGTVHLFRTVFEGNL